MSSSSDPIRILIADDHPLLREGIESLVGKQSDMTVVAEASTGRQAIELFRIHQPDVTLMDMRMPDLGGVDAMTEILRDSREAKFIVLSTYSGDVQICVHSKLEPGPICSRASCARNCWTRSARFTQAARE